MRTRILVLGATGMLGHVLADILSQDPRYTLCATIRSPAAAATLPPRLRALSLQEFDASAPGKLEQILDTFQPQLVVNCIGLVKQLMSAAATQGELGINSIFPHQINALCAYRSARFIHISTDCVFAGTRGHYSETDPPDAQDAYGVSKYLGEPVGAGSITVRTSIIGHELGSRHGLLEWFLGSRGTASGFGRAIFSGLTTVELSKVIRDTVIPNMQLKGLFHVAADPISKYDLLELLKKQYQVPVEIIRDDDFAIDRSLDGSQFSAATNYVAPPWPTMLEQLRNYHDIQPL